MNEDSFRFFCIPKSVRSKNLLRIKCLYVGNETVYPSVYDVSERLSMCGENESRYVPRSLNMLLLCLLFPFLLSIGLL